MNIYIVTIYVDNADLEMTVSAHQPFMTNFVNARTNNCTYISNGKSLINYI